MKYTIALNGRNYEVEVELAQAMGEGNVAQTQLDELKAMVSEIVMSVLRDNTARHVPCIVPAKEKSKGKKQ